MSDSATQKKPVYKRWWFILGSVVVVLMVIGSMTEPPTPETATAAGGSVESGVASSVGEGGGAEAGGEYLFREGDLALTELDTRSGEFGDRYVTGAIKNLSSRDKGYLQVEINLLNDAGDVVGSTLANVNNLAGGQTWRFEAPFMEEAATRYEVKGITGF